MRAPRMRPGTPAPHFKQYPAHFEPAPISNTHQRFDCPYAHFERHFAALRACPAFRTPMLCPSSVPLFRPRVLSSVRPRHQDGVNPTLGNGANGTHGDVGKNSTVANDLTTRLSQTLNSYAPYGSSTHQLIQRVSGVVAFEIVVASSFSSFSNTSAISTIDAGRSANTASPEPLAFPATLHMYQFLDGDLDPANKTRVAEGVARREIGVLASRRGVLVGFKGQDTLGNLRGAIEYYEHVAACDSPEHFSTLRKMAGKLGMCWRRWRER
ncbi:hypothetical protein DFH08DRAFT_1055353 [Mycena albidolilacea]|uniref:Uncharacterized protein n=1 Tax=Mycena albidolilacea TaxID=1033008 RepID=A0AAD7E9H2_9AGAR|nr:hypothetical protein DFH08DRAFT_1055353 [Mycena albidolilacea]